LTKLERLESAAVSREKPTPTQRLRMVGKSSSPWWCYESLFQSHSSWGARAQDRAQLKNFESLSPRVAKLRLASRMWLFEPLHPALWAFRKFIYLFVIFHF